MIVVLYTLQIKKSYILLLFIPTTKRKMNNDFNGIYVSKYKFKKRMILQLSLQTVLRQFH